MYNWRIRSLTDAKSIISRYYSYFESKYPDITFLKTTLGSTICYINSECGDDTTADGSMEKPYASIGNAYQSFTANTIFILVGDFLNEDYSSYTSKIAIFLADTYGSAAIRSRQDGLYVRCFIKEYSDQNNASKGFIDCIIDCQGYICPAAATEGYFKTTIYNAKSLTTRAAFGSIEYSPMMNSVFINSNITNWLQHTNAKSGCWIENMYINCTLKNTNITDETVAFTGNQYCYNCDIRLTDEEKELASVKEISMDDYPTLTDFLVDPSHMNYDLKRSCLKDEFFEDYTGVTGEAVSFNQVVGSALSKVNGIYSIDPTVVGRGYLVTDVLSNLSNVANTFVGFSTKMIHLGANNITLGSFERYDTANIFSLAAGESGTLPVSTDTVYLVNNDCTIDGEDVSEWSIIEMEASSAGYPVTAGTEDLKIIPYKYATINNYFGIRFKNMFDTTAVKAGVNLENDCSYFNNTASGINVTKADGTIVTIASKGTYIATSDTDVADGVLLKVFDKDDTYNQLNTGNFQTTYKAGYLLPSFKTYDNKNIPLTDAFGEKEDSPALDSLNFQFDFMQVRIDYQVYDF